MIKFYVPKTFLKTNKMQIILDRKNWPRLISEMNTFSARKLAASASGYALPHIIFWPKFVSMNGSSNVIMPIHFERYLLSSFWVSNDHFLNENESENEKGWSLWSLIIFDLLCYFIFYVIMMLFTVNPLIEVYGLIFS